MRQRQESKVMKDENKIISVAEILFKSMEQSLQDMKRGDFEMNSAAFMEKAKTLARFLKEDTVTKNSKSLGIK